MGRAVGLTDNARHHVMCFRLTRGTRAYNVEDDATGFICKALAGGKVAGVSIHAPPGYAGSVDFDSPKMEMKDALQAAAYWAAAGFADPATFRPPAPLK